jgi:tetratricopeptide (TPR) repeat protein
MFGRARSADVPSVEIKGVHPSVSKLLTDARLRVEQQPDSGHAWGYYGICLMQHERPHEALQCFREAIKWNSSNAKWPYFSGVILEQTNLQEAASFYETAIRLKPDYPPLLLRYAAIQITLGNFSESSRRLEEIQNNFPTIAETYVQLVRLERLRGAPCESSRWIMEARRMNAVSSALLQEGASAEMQCGNRETARLLLNESQSVSPLIPLQDPWMNPLKNVDATGAIASASADAYRQQGQIERAADELATLARQFPQRSRPALNHALALSDQGRTEEALQVMTSVSQKFPDDPLVHFHFAIILASSDHTEAAEIELRECLRLKADYGTARAALGDLLAARGEFEEAIQCYRQAVNDSVGDPWIRFGLTALLIRQGKSADATIVLNEAEPLLAHESSNERSELERLRLEIQSSSTASDLSDGQQGL